ncbi:MAG: VanW family protein [Chloroflexota bacterium]|nr:VanW family protein [Chloroflexota bacterium]
MKSHSLLKKHVFVQLFLAIPLSLVIFIMMAMVMLFSFEVGYANRIYPGVYVDDLDLSGLTLEEAGEHLAEALPYSYEGELTFFYDGRDWEAQPIDLGYLIDPGFNAQRAYDIGRRGWLANNLVDKGRAWFTGLQLSPVVYFDERVAQAYLQSIAEDINQPVVEASLGLDNTDVIVVSGQVGLEVDIKGTLILIEQALGEMRSAEIPMIVTETVPEVMDVGFQAETAREMLSKPLVLSDSEGEGGVITWTISPEELAAMLTIKRVKEAENEHSGYQIALNDDLFGVYLNSLAPGLSVAPVNTRFTFNDDTHQLEVIKPAVIGRKLDVPSSITQINQSLQKGEHEVGLKFEPIQPAVTDDMTGESLGITELVLSETSYFYGSDAARVQNIEKAAAQFHGLLIAPGETFSMGDALGNISLENGYAEALIIYGGQTIQGVGGGVCQVSTTLFRTAFKVGFPIVERHAHAYRVGYYEMTRDGSKDPNLAGLDATVYFPIVDLIFTNDTEHWLLMETYMGQYDSLTWKFYSTKDGRTVDWQTTGPTNVIPAPEPLYRENLELEKGEIKKVDYAADGAEISITRTVYKNDLGYFSDSFYTKFRPWQAVFEYGPGTEIPDSEED